MNVITAKKIPDEQMMQFLPKLFGARLMMHGEALVNSLMRRMCETYDGGCWEYFSASNGALYMAPKSIEPMRLANGDNYSEAIMSAEAAGIVCTLIALSEMMGRLHDVDPIATDKLNEAHSALSDYVSFHPEREKIRDLTD